MKNNSAKRLAEQFDEVLAGLDQTIANLPVIPFDYEKHTCPKCGSEKVFGQIMKHLDSENTTAQCGECGYIDLYPSKKS